MSACITKPTAKVPVALSSPQRPLATPAVMTSGPNPPAAGAKIAGEKPLAPPRPRCPTASDNQRPGLPPIDTKATLYAAFDALKQQIAPDRPPLKSECASGQPIDWADHQAVLALAPKLKELWGEIIAIYQKLPDYPESAAGLSQDYVRELLRWLIKAAHAKGVELDFDTRDVTIRALSKRDLALKHYLNVDSIEGDDPAAAESKLADVARLKRDLAQDPAKTPWTREELARLERLFTKNLEAVAYKSIPAPPTYWPVFEQKFWEAVLASPRAGVALPDEKSLEAIADKMALTQREFWLAGLWLGGATSTYGFKIIMAPIYAACLTKAFPALNLEAAREKALFVADRMAQWISSANATPHSPTSGAEAILTGRSLRPLLLAARDIEAFNGLAPAHIDGLLAAMEAHAIDAQIVLNAASVIAKWPPDKSEEIAYLATTLPKQPAALAAFYKLIIDDPFVLHGDDDGNAALARLLRAANELRDWNGTLAPIDFERRVKAAADAQTLGLEPAPTLRWVKTAGGFAQQIEILRYPGVSAEDEAPALAALGAALEMFPPAAARRMMQRPLPLRLWPKIFLPERPHEKAKPQTAFYDRELHNITLSVEAMQQTLSSPTKGATAMRAKMAHELAHVFCYALPINFAFEEALWGADILGVRRHRQVMQKAREAKRREATARARKPLTDDEAAAITTQFGAVSEYAIKSDPTDAVPESEIAKQNEDLEVARKRDGEYITECLRAAVLDFRELQSLDPVMAATISGVFTLVERNEVDKAATLLLMGEAPDAAADALAKALPGGPSNADLLRLERLGDIYSAIASAFAGWRPANPDVYQLRRQEAHDLLRSAEKLLGAVREKRTHQLWPEVERKLARAEARLDEVIEAMRINLPL